MNKNKTFYACEIPDSELERLKAKTFAFDKYEMFNIILHNQAILSEKLNRLLNKKYE